MPDTRAASFHRGIEIRTKMIPIGNKHTLAKSHPLNAIHYTVPTKLDKLTPMGENGHPLPRYSEGEVTAVRMFRAAFRSASSWYSLKDPSLGCILQLGSSQVNIFFLRRFFSIFASSFDTSFFDRRASRGSECLEHLVEVPRAFTSSTAMPSRRASSMRRVWT